MGPRLTKTRGFTSHSVSSQYVAAQVAAAEEESGGGADVAAGGVAKEDGGNENNSFSESVRVFAILKPAVNEGMGDGKALGKVLTLNYEGSRLALQCCEEKTFTGPLNKLNYANIDPSQDKAHSGGPDDSQRRSSSSSSPSNNETS